MSTIAGVMGGADSAIGDDTVDIVLESAHFTRKAVAGTARRYGLHTESSQRFERGVDPLLCDQAMQRASELVLEICGGHAGPVCQSKNQLEISAKPAVELRLSRLESLLGMSLDADEVSQILHRIADQVSGDHGQWVVTPPSFRFDLEREADLVEEVARVKGYDNIPVAMPRIAPRSVVGTESFITDRQVRQALVARDYREAITYSFIEPKLQQAFDSETPVRLANPLAENMSVMRTSLIPGLVQALQFNLNRQRDRVRLFEVGASYHKAESGYREVKRLAGVVCGARLPVQWGISEAQNVDFYDIKADLDAVLSLTGQPKPIIFEQSTRSALHPGQQALLTREVDDGTGNEESVVEIGWLGRLHPELEKQFDVNNVFAFELNLETALVARRPSFTTVSRYPSVKRDMSVVVDDAVPVAALMRAVEGELGSPLRKVELFDVYRGAGVTEGSKSVSMSLELRFVDRTMTDEEVDDLFSSARAVLEKEFGATLRS